MLISLTVLKYFFHMLNQLEAFILHPELLKFLPSSNLIERNF